MKDNDQESRAERQKRHQASKKKLEDSKKEVRSKLANSEQPLENKVITKDTDQNDNTKIFAENKKEMQVAPEEEAMFLEAWQAKLTKKNMASSKNALENKVSDISTSQAVDTLKNEPLSTAVELLANYFHEQMQGQKTITTDHQRAMKEKVIEILSPLASNAVEEKNIKDIAGTIVRDAATIAGKTLDWQQKLIKIKNAITKSISNILFSSEKNKFAEIVQDPTISEKLRIIKETGVISTAPPGEKEPTATISSKQQKCMQI